MNDITIKVVFIVKYTTHGLLSSYYFLQLEYSIYSNMSEVSRFLPVL